MLYGDTETSAALRHEVPIVIGDPFLLVADAKHTWIESSSLEAARLAVCRPDAQLIDIGELGMGERFEAEGYSTQRTGPGEDPQESFQFSLGHGVGLRVHEAPALGQTGREPFVAGDVVAIEPGLWDRTVGGVRYEDLLLVTDDGCETLTGFGYSLDPRDPVAE